MQNERPKTKPFISPTHRLCCWALQQIGLPSEAQQKALDKLGAEYDAVSAGLAGLSFEDARKAFKAVRHDPEKSLDWPTVERRYSLRRLAVRKQMLAVSKQAKAIVADIFDAGAAKMPALAVKIDKQERALVAGQGPEAKSHLVQSIEVLETHLKLRAKMLRESEGISHPTHLFDA